MKQEEPQLYLCDDWIRPSEVIKKPCALQRPQDKLRARVVKNFLLVTLMSLNKGYGSLTEDYQQADMGLNPPMLSSISLTEEEVQDHRDGLDQRTGDGLRCMRARLPPSTILARHLTDVTANSSAIGVVKDSSLKLYHVMSVKQSLREDLAEHSYQFSCRAADWSKMSFSQAPMQFVPDYFQQPAKASTEDVSVMRGPQAEEWIQAVREETESLKKLGVYEETSKDCATSTPLPHSSDKAERAWRTSQEEG